MADLHTHVQSLKISPLSRSSCVWKLLSQPTPHEGDHTAERTWRSGRLAISTFNISSGNFTRTLSSKAALTDLHLTSPILIIQKKEIILSTEVAPPKKRQTLYLRMFLVIIPTVKINLFFLLLALCISARQ